MAHTWTIDITSNKVLECWKPIPLVPILINSNIQTDDAKPLSFFSLCRSSAFAVDFLPIFFWGRFSLTENGNRGQSHISLKCLYPWRQTGKKIVTAQLNTFSNIVATSFLRMFADFTFSPYPSFYIPFFLFAEYFIFSMPSNQFAHFDDF